MHCARNAATFPTFEAALSATRDSSLQTDHHGEALRTLQGDWHNDHRDEAATITYGIREVEESFILFGSYMDAGCMTARPQTPAKRLAALFRRVGLSHLCITDENNVFVGMITRRSLITVQQAAEAAEQGHGHGGHAASVASALSAAADDAHSEDHIDPPSQVRRRSVSGARHTPKVQSIAEENDLEERKE